MFQYHRGFSPTRMCEKSTTLFLHGIIVISGVIMMTCLTNGLLITTDHSILDNISTDSLQLNCHIILF
jgi:hypothetical protein